ncbi:unnamed protein product [Parnassius mnemosyne]|uniref:Reverse transcriptase domain-containing protein n=1 Tax=Parnassius mnemosyne TaxID=213953 RepID=A0AAV1L2T9_9NEOP
MSSDDDSFLSANEFCSSNDSYCSFTETLGDFVRRKFEQPRSLFNVCHINAQSVPSHYSDLTEAFTDADVHAVLISETWFKPHLPSTSYPLSGFSLIRNDRVDRRGGGVAIYLRCDFSYKIVASSSPYYTASAEFLFLEVCVKGAKLILGVVYCPPSVDYFSSLETILESLGSKYSHHIIMGDFNTDLLTPHSSRSSKLLHIVESVGLHILPLQATHHNIDVEDTWLDLILTSAPSLVFSHGQHFAPAFSYHDLIFISYVLKPPKPPAKTLHMRCFGRLDVEKLCMDASKINWNSVVSASTVDEKIEALNEAILRLYDVHAPIKKVKLKRPPAPWMTIGVRIAMRRRDRAFGKFRKDRCDENWTLYKVARNRCNQMIRNAKRRFILSNISSSSPANIWKFLGTLGIGKRQRCEFQKTIGLDDINFHFVSNSPLDHQTKRLTIEHLMGLPRPDIDLFQFSPVAMDEIKKTILSIKSNAVGCDNISRRMILFILDHILPVISHIINFSLDSGDFPSLWRQAYVIPLQRITNPTLPNHFRPISILPFLSKVLEACVHKQLSQFISCHNLLSPLQSGFRPGHSTVSALLKVTGDIRAGIEDTKVTVLVLVDFSNAFNTISHDLLISILSLSMVSPEALDWFSSYLRGRQQSVRIDELSSSWLS